MNDDCIAEAIRLLDLSDGQRAAGHIARALADAEAALGILEGECGRDHPDVANALLTVGRCHEDADAYLDAEVCFRRAAAIMEAFEDQPVEVISRLRVQARTHVGQIERVLGRLDDAHATLRAAIDLAEERLAPDDADTAAALNALGIVCKYAGRFAEGDAAYRRALAITEKTCGKGSVDAASVWHNLGGLAFDAGDHAAAEGPARRAVEIRTAALGPDHPDLAADVAALAAIVDALGRTDEAEALHRHALDGMECRALRLGPASSVG